MPSKNIYADMLRQNELNYRKRLLNPNDSAIPAGYLPEEGVTESGISPIDLIPWETVAAIGAKGVKAAIKAAPKLIGNEVGAAGPGVQELARLDRAKKMGFDPETIWYHGTKADIKEFDPSKTNRKSMYGEGIYLTSEPEYANEFAPKTGGSVYPLHAKMEKSFNLNGANEEVLNDLYREIKKTNPKVSKDYFTDNYNAVNFAQDKLNPKELTKILQKHGYDSLVNPMDNIVVLFDPKNIRSKFAEFDPSKASSKDILAGLAAAGLWGEMASKKSKSPQEGF